MTTSTPAGALIYLFIKDTRYKADTHFITIVLGYHHHAASCSTSYCLVRTSNADTAIHVPKHVLHHHPVREQPRVFGDFTLLLPQRGWISQPPLQRRREGVDSGRIPPRQSR